MNNLLFHPLVLFWAAMIFGSIGWYALLLFYVGIKGGYEIFQMTEDLTAEPEGGQTH
jgi:hypothetical protein